MIAVLGEADSLFVTCAWAFALLRIAHSCAQAAGDVVMVCFSLLILSWLAIMIARACESSSSRRLTARVPAVDRKRVSRDEGRGVAR